MHLVQSRCNFRGKDMWAGYLAHSANDAGQTELLKTHLEAVARRAEGFGEAMGMATEARLAGLLHDVGKYGDLFQRRLKGEVGGLDHWSAGAWLATKLGRGGFAAAFAIQGHHAGLQCISAAEAKKLDPALLEREHPLNLRLTEVDVERLAGRMRADGLMPPARGEAASRYVALYNTGNKEKKVRRATSMLYARMLFSALVDADFIETEAHFKGTLETPRQYRQDGLSLKPAVALERLVAYLDGLAAASTAASHVKALRTDLLRACLAAAVQERGSFTLSAPTGAGKTLSMLAFALAHAAAHGLRRVIMVIPFLSIIDQTASEYRKVFAPHMGEEVLRRYILENHSLAGVRDGAARPGDEGVGSSGERLLAENWDAPIVITTSVQFLESLFANRPAACRKLHNIAGSVVLFDEVQTLPAELAVPTLATLAGLTEEFGCSVVLSTATQPAFEHLGGHVADLCGQLWQPREIVPPALDLFGRARRTHVEWPRGGGEATSWQRLADEVAAPANVSSLVIVNVKRHALALFERLRERGAEGLFHLSTSMCPAHRRVALEEVRRRLRGGLPCRLISTQCVEAGVDVDFPVVFRALGPLEAIAQAAGRCNRNGHAAAGEVRVFVPEEEIYPGESYAQAASVTSMLLADGGPMDIDDPGLYKRYYRALYQITRPEEQKAGLINDIRLQDFPAVAKQYRLIDKACINVLVPYDLAAYDALAAAAHERGLSAAWISRARAYTIGIFRPAPCAPILDRLEAIPLSRAAGGGASEDWFIYLKPEHYSRNLGLVVPDSMDNLIG